VLASKEEKPCDYGVLVIKIIIIKKNIYIYIYVSGLGLPYLDRA